MGKSALTMYRQVHERIRVIKRVIKSLRSAPSWSSDFVTGAPPLLKPVTSPLISLTEEEFVTVALSPGSTTQ